MVRTIIASHLIRQRDYLLEVSRALTSQLSLNDVLKRILRAATEMLGGQAGLIALANNETFSVRVSYGIPSALLHFFAPLLVDIPRKVPVSLATPELDHKVRIVARAAGLGFHQALAIPMTFGDTLIGVIYIFRAYRGAFDQNAVELLQSFAHQAAIATQNARLYEQVAAEKQQLDAILLHSADGIAILAADQQIENINLTLSRMVGVSIEEARNCHHDEIIRLRRRESGMELSDAVAGGWPLTETSTLFVEGVLVHTSGSVLSVEMTYVPLFDANGQFTNIIVSVHDITRFRQAEEAKKTFVSVISHELKTPVSVIKGYAGTLRRDDADWDQATMSQGLRIIEEEADHLSSLIEDLLDTTRLQTEGLSLSLSSVALDEIVRDVAEKFRHQTTAHKILVEFPLDFPHIQGDQQRLKQVIENLLSNAMKYSPDGGTIEITGEILSDDIRISIQDEGIGIPNSQHERIFERFYRIDNDLSRETQGAGLGLFIVRSIIEAHGGEITIESKSPKGIIFRFILPLSSEV
jgi:PAS domain S-box-containing protein